MTRFQRTSMAVLILALMGLLLAGCTRQQTLRPGDTAVAGLLGDEIQVTTRDGSLHPITLREISETHLIGETESIARDQVLFIECEKIDVGRTALILAGATCSVLLLVYLGLGGSNP